MTGKSEDEVESIMRFAPKDTVLIGPHKNLWTVYGLYSPNFMAGLKD
jgi:hypothetical protein